jgi:hypothetical protein
MSPHLRESRFGRGADPRRRLTVRCKWISLVALLTLAASAAAQSTTLTYQGCLNRAGEPAYGLHDFRFKLFNAPSGGSQVGQTQCVDNLAVSDGLFVAQIDFGQQFANPNARYLEIEVRANTGLSCGSATGFVVLTPRQLLTAAPLANHAKSAFALDAKDGGPRDAVFVDNEGRVGIGTTAPTAPLEVVGGPVVVQNAGDQADLLWLASERSWVFRQEGIGAGTALKLESIGGGGNKNFLIDTDGFTGIGTNAPLAKLDVRGDIRLGSSGQFLAPGAAENLRIIRGTVAANGSILGGSGFEVQHSNDGSYLIVFDSPFAELPTVTAMSRLELGASPIQYRIRDRGGIELVTFDNSEFMFIAIGPR